MENLLDLIIVGSGPAGITAAIYAKRYGMTLEIFEKAIPGGNVVNAFEIENYPGFSKIHGFELALNMQNQLKSLGVNIKFRNIIGIEKNEDGTFNVKASNGEIYHSKFVILALGSKPKTLEIYNEQKFLGRGISYCATCDGSFYKDKDVVVVGGGNSAITEALYLATICKTVTIIARKDIRASKAELEKLLSKNNVIIKKNTSIMSLIESNNTLVGVNLRNNETDELIKYPTNGIFVYIGSSAPTKFLEPLNIVEENSYIKVDNNFETDIKGLFSVGDSINKRLRQIVTAQSDAAIAVDIIKERL
jgi:thioredoxin reductase (NADPH)